MINWILFLILNARIDDHWAQNKLRVIYTGKQMQFAVANPFTHLLPSENMFMWKRLWSQDFQDEPWKILTGKQITMKLSSASSEFCGSTRSMSKVMSVIKFIDKSFTQYQILSFCKLADYLISQICIVGRNIISPVPICLMFWSCNENFLNMNLMNSRICFDYRTTISSNSFMLQR